MFFIIGSKEERYLPGTDYNKRRKECNDAVKKIQDITKNKKIKSLSDVNIDLLLGLKNKLPIKLFKRAKHIVTENERVLKSKEYLKRGDIKSLGATLFESHQSLKKDYKVSTDKLDFLVATGVKWITI